MVGTPADYLAVSGWFEAKSSFTCDFGPRKVGSSESTCYSIEDEKFCSCLDVLRYVGQLRCRDPVA